jgi:hypothetical protein
VHAFICHLQCFTPGAWQFKWYFLERYLTTVTFVLSAGYYWHALGEPSKGVKPTTSASKDSEMSSRQGMTNAMAALGIWQPNNVTISVYGQGNGA